MNALPNENLIRAMGWTLIHSLWLGAIIAALTAAILFLLRGHSARARYAVSCAGLAALAASVIVTFAVCWPRAFAPPSGSVLLALETGASALAPALPPGALQAPPQSFRSALDSALPWIVLLWALGVGLLSLRCAGSWRCLRRLRRASEAVSDADLLDRFENLARRVSLSRPVRLMQSALLEVPMAAGWLKPVIILPVATIAGLSPAQLEAILMHELAHILRRDYLVNLAQVALETLLFYHPAVWWMSRRIREEREYCCDDLVLGAQHNAAEYAKALAALEGARSAAPQLGMAAHGGSLVRRIRRISGGSASVGRAPGGAAFAVIATVAAGAWIFVSGLVAAEANAKPAPAPQQSGASSLEKGDKGRFDGIAILEEKRWEQQLMVEKLAEQLRKLEDELGMSEQTIRETASQRATAIKSMEEERTKLRLTRLQWEPLLDELKKKSPERLRAEITTLSPDPVLQTLFELEAKASQKLQTSRVNSGESNPEVVEARVLQERIMQQIDDRASGIVAGMQSRLESYNNQLKNLELMIEEEKLAEKDFTKKTQGHFQLRRDLEARQRIVEILMLRQLQELVDAQMVPPTTDANASGSAPCSGAALDANNRWTAEAAC